MGLAESTIASISLGASIAGAIGSIAGGWISDATGRPRGSLAVFYGLMAVPTVLLATRFESSTGTAGVTVTALVAAVTSYNMFYGMRQAAFAGVFMRITNPAVAATQFTGYMSLANVGLTYSGLWQGRFADAHGYGATLFLDAAIGLIGAVVLPWVRQRSSATAR
jgi:PAT family beta-lactamase induction signal transducer AmpG